MLFLFYVILIAIFIFNPHGKGRGLVSGIIRTSVKVTLVLMGILILISYLLKIGVLH